ncbi:MAG: hypothetical protein U9P50_02425 [Patescibacteria group bacterium]|nr:hypothetical protein [Patescibacteria group bacterium]
MGNSTKPRVTRRINIRLDEATFAKLAKMKGTHKDPTFTQTIRRAIATLDFIENQKEEKDLNVYIGKEGGNLQQVIFVT